MRRCSAECNALIRVHVPRPPRESDPPGVTPAGADDHMVTRFFFEAQVTRGKKAGESIGLVLTAVRLKLREIKQAATAPVRSLRLTVLSPTMYGNPYLL